MGWLNNLLNKIAGVAPTDWTLYNSLTDPGLNISGKAISPDKCYIELYVESVRLEKARRFATNFHGVVYSFASLARHGANRTEVASVTKPQKLATLDPKNLDRVIPVSKRIMKAIPWRGDPLGLELGLFSVKSGNVLTPLIDYVAKVSDKAGIGAMTKLNPFVPLIGEGLDIIAGQTEDTAIELAVDTDMTLNESCFCALIAKPKGTVPSGELTIDPQDRKLLRNAAPFEAAYCVFSIRSSDRNPDWGTISALQDSYADFVRAITSGRHTEAEEALAGFNRQVVVCPDLISADKELLRRKAKEDLEAAFPGGAQAAVPAAIRQRFGRRQLVDLNIYGDLESA